jgi:hypothetical protein
MGASTYVDLAGTYIHTSEQRLHEHGLRASLRMIEKLETLGQFRAWTQMENQMVIGMMDVQLIAKNPTIFNVNMPRGVASINYQSRMFVDRYTHGERVTLLIRIDPAQRNTAKSIRD